jgi:hypothetical protein
MKYYLLFFLYFCSCLLSAQTDFPVTLDRDQQIEYIKNNSLPIVITPLPKRINSQFSEYNGILFRDSLFYFTVLQDESSRDFEDIFESYWSMKIYRARLSRLGYSKPIPLPKELNERKYFCANFTFNQQRDEIYFSRCPRTVNQELQCDIWYAKYRRGKWGSLQKLPDIVNVPGYNITQPFLVEYEQYRLLYFASNRPNGYGNMDIWCAIIKNGKYENPVNLGSFINTAGNEVTPFYDQENNILYFSSDTHTGLGGFDVFSAHGELSDWSTPDNLGVPINTEYHEIYFTCNSFNHGGYFSSNRPHSGSKPKDTCCYDLFSYQHLPHQTALSEESLQEDTLSAAEKISSYLPLPLYFHNDIPDPYSKKETTNANYINTLEDYIEMRSLYKQEYAKGLKGREKEKAEEKIDNFFTQQVEKGYEHLNNIVNLVVKELKEGHSVSILLSGYSSALHAKDYNRALALRRIMSFENYLRSYENGLLAPYMDNKRKNTLQIIPDPVGSEEAIRKQVSSSSKDKRNSIYSVEASAERRIEITHISIDTGF